MIKISADLFDSPEPQIMRGLVAEWPAVKAGVSSVEALQAYLLGFDQRFPLTVYEASSETKGRLFYNSDYSGFNFDRKRRLLSDVLDDLNGCKEQADQTTYYVGSTMVKRWLPGFDDANKLELGDRDYINSVWLGNRSVIAPHFDFPSNIACVLCGRRRFTLFPPEHYENLYVGPFDFNPSGQPISMVDIKAPDYDAFPKYKKAEADARVYELEAGDAIYIPSMWWHSVEALGDFNLLSNYWWRATPSYLGSPLAAMQHAMLSFHDLPPEQLVVWKNLFSQLIFDRDDHSIEHIPSAIRGMLGEIDEATAVRIRRAIADALKG